MEKFEIGYTPKNIRMIITPLGETWRSRYQKAASLIQVGPGTVANWCRNPESDAFRTMPHKKWLELLASTATTNKPGD